MGGQQAASTLLDIQAAQLKRQGQTVEDEALAELRRAVAERYEDALDIRYAAARLWVDEIVAPDELRTVLVRALEACAFAPVEEDLKLGVFQV